MFPKKLVQRHISNLRLHLSDLGLASFLILLPYHGQPFVEFVDLAVPRYCCLVSTTLSLHLSARLHAPGPKSIQRNRRHQWKNCRKAQAQMDSLKQTKIALAYGFRIELLQRLPEEIDVLPFLGILAHLLHRRLQCVRHAARTLRRLGGVLANVFNDRPQIQAGTPVHIAHVRQKYVGLMAGAKWIVPRKERSPRSLLLALLQLHLPIGRTSVQLLRKTVPAIQALRLASGTSIPRGRWPRLAVAIVSSRPLHQRSN